jgi:hypothetical protein
LLEGLTGKSRARGIFSVALESGPTPGRYRLGQAFGFVLPVNYHWWLVYESGWIWTDINAGISQRGESAH